MNVFMYSANAVLPIVLLILLGYFLRRKGFYDEKFLKTANKLGFRAALPTLLFYNVYSIESLQSINWSTVIYALCAVAVLFTVGFFGVKLFVKDDRQKGVMLQSAFRSNFAIIGIPLAGALGGDDCLAVVSVLSAFTIAAFNILAVIALTVFIKDGEKGKINMRDILIKIAKNPLIIGIFLGLAAVFIRSFIPVGEDGTAVFTIENNIPFLYSAIKTLSTLATPLMLIVLGGQFSFSAIGTLKKQIISGTLLRLVFAPLVGIGGAYLLDRMSVIPFSASEYAAFIALFGSPIAVSSAVMASEMNNDEQLAGQLVVWTSIGSVFTVFTISAVLKYAGLL